MKFFCRKYLKSATKKNEHFRTLINGLFNFLYLVQIIWGCYHYYLYYGMSYFVLFQLYELSLCGLCAISESTIN